MDLELFEEYINKPDRKESKLASIHNIFLLLDVMEVIDSDDILNQYKQFKRYGISKELYKCVSNINPILLEMFDLNLYTDIQSIKDNNKNICVKYLYSKYNSIVPTILLDFVFEEHLLFCICEKCIDNCMRSDECNGMRSDECNGMHNE